MNSPHKPPINAMIHSADVALAAYPSMQDDTATNLRDLLTDLMHLCDAKGIDFKMELRVAKHNYQMEVKRDNAK